MTASRWALAGGALLAAHLGLAPALFASCERPALAVRVSAPAAAPRLDITAALPDGLADRVAVYVDGLAGAVPLTDAGDAGPGMHRVEWRARYRGGFERRVGVTQLVGPFQDPAAPPCAARVVLGQSLLDDGAAGPGTIAGVVRAEVERQLAGLSQWPLGAFVGVSELRARWIAADDLALYGPALAIARKAQGLPPAAGVAHVALVLSFERARVPLAVAVTLDVAAQGDALAVTAHVAAGVAFERRVYQWIADLVDADGRAAAIAREELAGALQQTIPIPTHIIVSGEESGGASAHASEPRTIRFSLCRRPIEIVTDSHAAIGLAVAIADAPVPAVAVGAPSADPGEAAPGAPVAPISVELELDAINAILHELWRSGHLDRAIAAYGAAERFNRDPLVERLLSVRISDIALALPPTASPAPAAAIGDEPGATGPDFQLGAEAALMIRDGETTTPARAFAAVGFAIADHGAPSAPAAMLSLRELALTCEPAPGLLVPCYADLVAAFTDRADAIHGALTRAFDDEFRAIVLGRELGVPGGPRFTVDRAETRARAAGRSGVVRVELFGRLVGQQGDPAARSQP